MDEPASALDPIATVKIEDLMQELKADYSIVIVTHNMQQAARVSDETAFLYTQVNEEAHARWGVLVEFGDTSQIFTRPKDKTDRGLRLRSLRIGAEGAGHIMRDNFPQGTRAPGPGRGPDGDPGRAEHPDGDESAD